MKIKKFLCVCEGGNVRSVGMAWALKSRGQDALAIGHRFVSPATKKMLCEWADYIILMQLAFKDKIASEFKDKVRVVDVGEDCYGYAFHPQLQGFVNQVAEQWQTSNFEI